MLDRSKDAQGNTAASPVKRVEITTEQQTYTMEPNEDGDLAVVGIRGSAGGCQSDGESGLHTGDHYGGALVAESPENPGDYGLDEPRGVRP